MSILVTDRPLSVTPVIGDNNDRPKRDPPEDMSGTIAIDRCDISLIYADHSFPEIKEDEATKDVLG